MDTHCHPHTHIVLVFYPLRNLEAGVRSVSGLSLTLHTDFLLFPISPSLHLSPFNFPRLHYYHPPFLFLLLPFWPLYLHSPTLFSHSPIPYPLSLLLQTSLSSLSSLVFFCLLPLFFFSHPPPGLSIFSVSNSSSYPAPRSLHSATINYTQTQCASLCSPRQIIQFILAKLCILNDECIDYAIKQGCALKHSQSAPIHALNIPS